MNNRLILLMAFVLAVIGAGFGLIAWAPSPGEVPSIPGCTLSVNFDVETIRVIRPLNPADQSNLSKVDKINLIPVKTNDKIAICLDGSDQTTRDPIPYGNDQQTPGASGKIMLEGEKIKFFNKSGGLEKVHEKPSEGPSFAENIFQQFSGNCLSGQPVDLKNLQKEADAIGGSINHYGDDLVGIKTADGESFFDKNTSLLSATQSYGPGGMDKEVIIRYNGRDCKELSRIIEKEKMVSPSSGITMEVITIHTIDNFSIYNNN